MTTSDIPYGYCHCGCGKKTTIAKQDIKRYGQRDDWEIMAEAMQLAALAAIGLAVEDDQP